jgi:hypothetical protein
MFVIKNKLVRKDIDVIEFDRLLNFFILFINLSNANAFSQRHRGVFYNE